MFPSEPEYKIVERVRTRLGTKPDDNPAFTGVVKGKEVSYLADVVMFSDKVTTVLAQLGESTWRLAVDTWDSTLGIWRPMTDPYTPKRVDPLMSLVSTELFTRTGMCSEDPEEITILSRHVVALVMPEITATQCPRPLVAECPNHGVVRVSARGYLESITRSAGESDISLAVHFFLAIRAAAADLDRPHTFEAALF